MSIPIDETLHKDPVLEAMSESQQKICAELAGKTAKAFLELGFDVVIIRLAKIVRGKNGECALPGSTAAAVQPAVAPCLMLEAQELRSIAGKFEREFERSGCKSEAHEGYVREVQPKDVGL